MRIDLITTGELGPAEIQQWRRLQGEDRTVAAPGLSPGWARCVGRARADARIAAIRDRAGRIQGFLPIQAGKGGLVEPLGASLNLGCGIVGDPRLDWDASGWLADIGSRGLEFQGAPERQLEFARASRGGVLRLTADLQGGAASYVKRKREDDFDVLEHRGGRIVRLAAEKGSPRVRLFSYEGPDFSQTLYWSAGAFRRPQEDWEIAALRSAFEHDGEDGFRGALFTLHVGDSLAAGAFFLIDGCSAQIVFYGEAPGLERYEPAAIVLADAISAFAARGIVELDLGAIEGPLAREFATGRRQRLYGLIRPVARKKRFPASLAKPNRRAEREWSRIGPVAV
jgi:CelD/BcsL family acetyltransferase involved in cellulose biosynthesis